MLEIFRLDNLIYYFKKKINLQLLYSFFNLQFEFKLINEKKLERVFLKNKLLKLYMLVT